MIISTKKYDDDFEIVKMESKENHVFTLEVFKVPEGFKSFAHDNSFLHYDLEGYGAHPEKEKSMKFAVTDLEELIEEFDKKLGSSL